MQNLAVVDNGRKYRLATDSEERHGLQRMRETAMSSGVQSREARAALVETNVAVALRGGLKWVEQKQGVVVKEVMKIKPAERGEVQKAIIDRLELLLGLQHESVLDPMNDELSFRWIRAVEVMDYGA